MGRLYRGHPGRGSLQSVILPRDAAAMTEKPVFPTDTDERRSRCSRRQAVAGDQTEPKIDPPPSLGVSGSPR